MTKRNVIEMNLPTADDLFSTQEERDNEKREYVKAIPLDQIRDFPNHPFKVRMDEKMIEMIESVREYGVLSPAVVRPKEDGTYEMIAGHRRKLASQMADRSDMPCIVRDLTDEEATIIMVDSNLQREEILPSEKAFAYKMKLDAMKRQGQRTDLTSDPLEPKWRSNEELAKKSGDSVSQIKRYIRLTELIKPILDMVDDKKIALCGIIPVVWFALLTAPYIKSGLIGILQGWNRAFKKPFDITICEDSLQTALIFLLCYFFGIGIYLTTRRNYRKGKEHGSAAWGDAREINKRYSDKNFTANKIMTQHVRISYNSRKHRRNLLTVVIGGSGSGKTRHYGKINLYQARGQFMDSSYTPAEGDLIFFDWGTDGSIDHVGIVVNVEDGFVNTIEGNSSNKVQRGRYATGDSVIYGYGVVLE